MTKQSRVVPLLTPHDAAGASDSSSALLNIADAANRLCCSERFVRRLVQERRIPFVRLGGSLIRFVSADLDQWIAEQRVATTRKSSVR
jgi:excisionase family DNA binding protein